MKQHWLLQPRTIRALRVVGVLILALTLIAGLLVPGHGYFGIDGSFGFNAWYGFATCICMIVVAKALGRLLKRKDTWYDSD
jgi:hypothetical protein